MLVLPLLLRGVLLPLALALWLLLGVLFLAMLVLALLLALLMSGLLVLLSMLWVGPWLARACPLAVGNGLASRRAAPAARRHEQRHREAKTAWRYW
jgi:hypothetical protein